MNPRALLKQTAEAFREAGVPDPEVDSAALLSLVTGLPPLRLRLETDMTLSDKDLARFDELCRKRMARIPLQYLTGEQSFLGHPFHVDERVLIPRPETELLGERAIAALRQAGEGASALDLCCGSGCLCVSMALAVPDAAVTGADLSADALAVARGNAASLGAAVRFLQGDLWQAVGEARFDVIVSNPPYIPRKECDALQREVRQEPLMALDGGADGLDFYRRIAAEAEAHLTQRGVLLLETGWDQAQAVAALLRAAGLARTAIHGDLQGIERMVEAGRA